MYPLWTAISILAAVRTSIAQTNPITVKSAQWLGNVTSSNTGFSRDLGFQGQVGNCWVNTFGDDFLCSSANPQKNCSFEYITARNSCGRPTGTHTYEDLFVDAAGAPQQCIPDILFESRSNPAGITNAIKTGPNTGIIYFLAGNSTVLQPDGGLNFAGAGFAELHADSNCNIKVLRVLKNEWFGNLGGPLLTPPHETFYGDHGAVFANDGFIYAYGGIPGTGAVSVARVIPRLSSVLPAYEYWNGKSFQKARILNPTKSIAVMEGLGQGTPFFNKHYNVYMYISSFIGAIYVRTAPNPWGPWSPSVTVYTVDQLPYRLSPAQGSFAGFYTPAIQPKFSDPSGKSIVFWTTHAVGRAANDDYGGHQIITSVKINFE